MSDNLGTGVSYVNQADGYDYDMVVFQKGKPPMDSEWNLTQQIQRIIDHRQMSAWPSGWLSMRPFWTSPLLSNMFYTQNPSTAIPEYALVNGEVVYVTGTSTAAVIAAPNSNVVDLGAPPASGNQVNGVFLEVWRALLAPYDSANKPDPISVIDSIKDLDAFDSNHGWAVGDNGLVLATTNAGQTWIVQPIDTRYRLNGVSFVTTSIGWVAGNTGVMARTTSGGVRWNMLTTGITENLNAIHAVSQLMAWVVGDSGTILNTVNGITFTPQASGITANLRGVHFNSAGVVGWAVGENGTIVKTTSGGSTWFQVTSGTTATLNSVFFYDLNLGFAVGNGGTLLRTSDGGSTWVSQSGNVNTGSVSVPDYSRPVTADLMDVTISPSLDDFVNGEEISSQFNGTNKNGTVMNVPITKGDGNGTTTTNPGDITVKVNDVVVPVDFVNGVTGQIILHDAPRMCDVVKVYYWHRTASGVFRGRAWIVGAVGAGRTSSTVLSSVDVGANWIYQEPNTSYTLNAVAFSDNSRGWAAGDFSTIRYTSDGGGDDVPPVNTHWTTQQSQAVVRFTQRVFNEGNVKTGTYLDDDSIHPDANVETTKRVQLQYRIRVEGNVDPINYPDSGLGSPSVLGYGPGTTGLYAFQNMGPSTGDYGLWRAKCAGTVDGYCYAIPMFFVNRRNTSAFDAQTNTNGENKPGSFIRPDLLTAIKITDTDVLDVRRLCLTPDFLSLLDNGFDSMSSNTLRSNLFRETSGGDHYGTELLQVDRIAGTTGGQSVAGTLADAVAGNITSSVPLVPTTNSVTATAVVPGPVTLPVTAGDVAVFHQSLTMYSAIYFGTGASTLAGKPVPGAFSGLGTQSVTFTFSPSAGTTVDDPLLGGYLISGIYIKTNPSALNKTPASPALVQNFSGGAGGSFFYQGVVEGSPRIVEQWDSGLPNLPNYVVAYPGTDDSAVQETRASTLELHYFTKLSATNIVGNNEIKLPSNITVVAGDVPYVLTDGNTATVSKLNNLDAGFSYKMTNQYVGTDSLIHIVSATGFNFLSGTTVEMVASVLSSPASTSPNVRNGASVNFRSADRSIDRFCASSIITGTLPTASLDATNMSLVSGTVLGWSTAETVTSLTQSVAWHQDSTGIPYKMFPVTVTNLGSTLNLHFDTTALSAGNVQIQVMYQQSALPFPDGGGNGLYVSYDYVPFQGVSDLPSSLTVDVVTRPRAVVVTNLGTGGGNPGEPYANPLEHIPTNDPTLVGDALFGNREPLTFNNFSADGGFVQLPPLVPGAGGTLTFSSPAKDSVGRSYFGTCSRDVTFVAEGLTEPNPRKIYVALLATVRDSTTPKFLNGECLLVIMSRNAMMDTENWTGWKASSGSAIAVYRLPNKPTVRK